MAALMYVRFQGFGAWAPAQVLRLERYLGSDCHPGSRAGLPSRWGHAWIAVRLPLTLHNKNDASTKPIVSTSSVTSSAVMEKQR